MDSLFHLRPGGVSARSFLARDPPAWYLRSRDGNANADIRTYVR